MNKISHYFSTNEITRGLFIAVLSSAFIYLNHWGFSYPLFNTILGLLALYFLLDSSKKVWFFSGFFIGLLWFWWIILSFKHYEMLWAIPIGLLVITVSYGFIFWFIAKVSSIPTGYCGGTTPKHHLAKLCCQRTTPYIISLTLKASGLLLLSYIHPFNFDWLKPELMFVESYIGIGKWQFAIVLCAISLSLWKKQLLYLFLIVLAYQPTQINKKSRIESTNVLETIRIASTDTTVQDKWDKNLHAQQFDAIFKMIDDAIDNNKTLIILPESVFPVFLNRNPLLIETLQEKAKHISIVTGGLYWDGKTPRNSSYIFTNNKITVANKVLLVPFGESNPLPKFLSTWVNKVFYDDAVDYQASSNIIDYVIDDTTYRNAICFEATSEKLYIKDKEGKYPANMIVLSNNGWFVPSILPTLQKLLLQYYSKKYGTTIYHSVNMSDSYIVISGKHLDIKF